MFHVSSFMFYNILMSLLKKLILLSFLLILISYLISNIFNYYKKLDFYYSVKKNLEKEEKKQIKLQTEIIKKTNQEELEKIIRNQLNMTKDNEVIVLLPSPNITISPTPTPELKNWQKWLKVFLKK